MSKFETLFFPPPQCSYIINNASIHSLTKKPNEKIDIFNSKTETTELEA